MLRWLRSTAVRLSVATVVVLLLGLLAPVVAGGPSGSLADSISANQIPADDVGMVAQIYLVASRGQAPPITGVFQLFGAAVMESQTGSTWRFFVVGLHTPRWSAWCNDCGYEFCEPLGQYYLRARYYDQSKGRFPTMDTFEGRADEPLSIHKYSYSGNSPIDYVDPEGNDFSLSSLMGNMGMSSTIRNIMTPNMSQFLARSLSFFTGRKYTVYFTSSRSLAGIPSHWNIYINDTKTNKGFRYDVGLESLSDWRRAGSLFRYVKVFTAGQFSISATTFNAMKASSIKLIPFAKFAPKHLAIWSALAIPFGIISGSEDRSQRVPFSIPGYPLSFNCYKWTAEAAVAAAAIQLLP